MDMEIIAWIGFSQSLFAAILMKSKRNLSVPDRILTAWLVLLGVEFFTCAIDYRLFGRPLLSSSFLLFNPAVYLYIKSLTQPTFRLRWTQLLHLAPFILFELGAYILKEPYSLYNFLESDGTLWYRLLFSLASVLSWGYYNTWSVVLLHRHRMRIVNEFSTIERNKRMLWLLVVVVYYNLYCITAVVMGLLAMSSVINYFLPYIYNYSTLLFLVYILGFYGLRQEVIYSNAFWGVAPSKPENGNGSKYSGSNLSAQRKGSIKKSIEDYFIKDKPYLNSELSMSALSQQLGIPKHHITEVLSTTIGKNFFSYVNEFRVEAVKAMLADSKVNYSIEAIGYECGFSSKSSFFTVFKKIAGQTPTGYRQKLNDDYPASKHKK